MTAFSRLCGATGSLFLAFLTVTSTSAVAQSYTLTAGDRLTVLVAGVADPEEVMVDIDGQVRLNEVGGVTIAGSTLDEAEQKIIDVMVQRAILLDPTVRLNLVEYAPFIVAGDVASPGRYDYVPGLNVAAALALSGGSKTSGQTRTDVVRARTQSQADMRTANLALARTVVQLARTEAMINGDEATMAVTSDMLAVVPNPTWVAIDALIANETASLAQERSRTTSLLEFWALEIEKLTEQLANFEARISLQQEVAALAQQSLADARDLKERGLQTATRVADIEERETNARSRLLELETAKLSTERAISNAERERVNYLSRITETALSDRNALMVELQIQTVNYERARDLEAMLPGEFNDLVNETSISLQFSLSSSRPGRSGLTDLQLQSPVLPGETLTVRVLAR